MKKEDKIMHIISDCDKKINSISNKIKNKYFDADVIKTIKAMGYEKIKNVISKEE